LELLRYTTLVVAKPLTFLSFLLIAVGALAQGDLNFAGRIRELYDAPVFLCDGTPAAGDQYRVQLYAGVTVNSLAPIGDALPFRTGAAAGYWTATARTIDTVDATGHVYVQIRAWATAAGPTFEAAAATGVGFGFSNIITVIPQVAPTPPADLVGLASFSITCIPEPSTVLLAVLGSVPFLLRRRR